MNQQTLWKWFLPACMIPAMLGVLLGRMADSPLILLFALLPMAAAVILARGKLRFLFALAMTGIIYAAAGCFAYHPTLPPEGSYVVSGVVSSEIRTDERQHVRAELTDVTLNGIPVQGGAYWSYYGALPEGLQPGSRVEMTADVYHPEGASNPGGFDFREYLLAKRITLGVYGSRELTFSSGTGLNAFFSRVRHDFSEAFNEVLGDEAGAYAAAMILGNRTQLPEEDMDAYSRLGIAHILSVSGFHVGVLMAALEVFLRWLTVSRKWRFTLEAVCLVAYALLTGLHAPVTRAVLFLIIAGAGQVFFGRRCPSIHLLSEALLLILLFDPVQLTSASFQLSFCAILGLILIPPVLTSGWNIPSDLKKPVDAFAHVLGAQLGVLLPQLYWYHELPLLGLVLNMVIFSFGSLLIAYGWFLLPLTLFMPLAQLMGQPYRWMIRILSFLAGKVSAMDGITLWTKQANIITLLGWIGLMTAFSVFSGKKLSRRICALLSVLVITLSLIPLPHTGTDYIQFDVGSEDAALLRDGSLSIVIDTGTDGKVLTGYLHQNRITPDAVIVTHLHSDHAGGLSALMAQRIPVKVLYLPWGAEGALIDPGISELLDTLRSGGTEICYLARGDRLDTPSGSLTVLWPERDRVRTGQDANQSSLVLYAELQGVSMLLTGDLDGRYEMYAAEPADILKIAHHGSSASTSDAFLDAVSPAVMLLSGGDNTRYERMDARKGDAQLYATQSGGAIIIRMEEGTYGIQSFR